MTSSSPGKVAAYGTLALLLGINLFNYIDRQMLAAVEPEIRATFFAPNDPNAMTQTGLLGDAFLVTYMVSAPLLGWLSDRFSRWLIVGCAVALWSLASGATGLAGSFAILFGTRILVGIGEGGYGPAAPTILADAFPIEKRGRILAIFCSAIPVGSALGYVLGGQIGAHYGWRWAFYLVVLPGLSSRCSAFSGAIPAILARAKSEANRRHSRLSRALSHSLVYLQYPRSGGDDFCRRRTRFLDRRISAFSRPTGGERENALRRDHRGSRAQLDAFRRMAGRSVAPETFRAPTSSFPAGE